MNILDVRTIMVSQVAMSALGALVVAFLWWQNRRRFAGTAWWVVGFILQALAALLISLRGSVSDWVSIVFANTCGVAALVAALAGLERFFGHKGPHPLNLLLLAVFACVHTYFSLAQPDLAVRTLNLALAMLIVSGQCVWLLWRVPPGQRGVALNVWPIFGLLGLFSAARVIFTLASPHPSNDFFKSGQLDALVLLVYQVLLVVLAYGLTLMVNRRLLEDVRTQEGKFATVFRSAPYAIMLTRLSDGRILDVNDGFVQLSGYARAEVIGATTLGLRLWAREEDRVAVVSALAQGHAVRDMEFRFRTKVGDLLTGLVSAEVIQIDGQPWVLSSISDISDRKRKEETLAQRGDEFAALYEITQDLAAQHELQAVLERIVELAQRLIATPVGHLYLYDAARRDLTLAVVKGLPTPVGLRLALGEGMAGRVAQTRQPLIVDDYRTWPGRAPQLGHTVTAATVQTPLLYRGELIGVLGVGEIEMTERRFTDADLRLLTLFAGQAASVVANARLLEQIRRDITDLKQAQAAERDQRLLAEALRDAAATVASTLSFEDVLDRILAELARVVPHDAARIMLIEAFDSGPIARGVRGRGYDERPPAEPITALRLPVADTPNLRAMIETGRPLLISDTATYPGWVEHPQQPWVRSNAAAPLRARGRVIGFLSVDNATPGFFTPAHAERLQAFADQVTVALENARLYEDAQRRNRELTLLNRVAELASRPSAPAVLLPQILDELMSVLRFDAGWITLPGATLNDRPTVAASHGVSPQFVAAETAGPLVDCPACTYVLTHGRIAGPLMVAQCPRLDPTVIAAEGLLHHIGVPLQAGEGILGILNVGFRRPAPYDERERALLTAVGRQVGLALDNAHLYESLQAYAATLEATVARRTAELQQANERLKELNRLRQEFIAQASHELRTPLTNIKTSVYLLDRGRPEKRDQYMAILSREADLLHRLIEDLQALLTLDVGQLRPVKQPIAIGALVEGLPIELADLLASRALTLSVICPPELLQLQADPGLLKQALVNLVANASERAPYGREIIVVCDRQITEGDWITITVHEPEIVIASMAGAGLRRVICEEIARHHGGRLTDGERSVTLWLPVGGDGVTR